MSYFVKSKLLVVTTPVVLWAGLVSADVLVLQQNVPSSPAEHSLNMKYLSSNNFIVSNLLISVSRTVAVKIDESKTALAVASGSTQGKTVFAGHTDIGAVAPCFIVVGGSDGDLGPASPESLNHLDINTRTGCDVSSS